MLDTVGPELQVFNKTGNPIELNADDLVTITPDISKEPSADVLPINYSGLAEVCLRLYSIIFLEGMKRFALLVFMFISLVGHLDF